MKILDRTHPVGSESRVDSLPLNPYAFFLKDVEKPARYIGGEKYTIRKNWEQVNAKVALCFPDAYEIGMGHLGLKILYNELNKVEDILAERVFAPWTDLEEKLREHKLPLVSLESFRPLKDFHVLGFSLQYELTYTNILNMLDLGGVSLFQKDRAEDEPFVIVGGPCSTHPEPLAPFVDFVVVGDGEDLFVRLARKIALMKRRGIERKKILEELSAWDGIYVPSQVKTVIEERNDLEVTEGDDKFKRFFVGSLAPYPFPKTPPVPHNTTIFDNYSVELARGCTEGCRFCQAGMIYRPVRERHPEEIKQTVLEGLSKGGYGDASLTCLSTADYSAVTPLLIELLDEMKNRKANLGVASLRAYGLDNAVFDKMAEVRNSSLTFAPEAGSERMRKVINKNITEEDMLNTARAVFSRGFNKMKLYFMIGLPTETDEDVCGIMETAFKAKKIARECGVKNPQITVSVSSFVPKPHTPFQWSAMISMEEIERKQEMLFQLAKKYGLKFRKHFSRSSVIEGIVARGDVKVANVIYRAFKAGARFDGWNEKFDYDLWMKCMDEEGLAAITYLQTLPLDGKLPWDHIDVGLKDGFLKREWQKSLKDRLSPPCGKPAGEIVHYSNLKEHREAYEEKKRKLVCYHCGVKCDLTEMVKEREDFLTDLKAEDPIPEAEVKFKAKDILDRRAKRGQFVGFKYRLQFSKLGPLIFTSHLDLQAVMARIFKRAGVNILYSEGHNPRPLLSLGHALSLGLPSLGEWLDIRLGEPLREGFDWIDYLNKQSERGIIFNSMESIEHSTPALQKTLLNFSYFFGVSEKDAKEMTGEKLSHWGEWNMDVTHKTPKKGEFKVELKPFVAGVELHTLETGASELDLLKHTEPHFSHKGIVVSTQVVEGRMGRADLIKKVLERELKVSITNIVKLK